MAFECQKTSAHLSSLVTKIRSGATPKGGAESYLPARQRYALVRSQNVFDHRFDEKGLAFISDQQAQDLAGAELQANDVLLNITGDGITFGRACLVPSQVLPACVNQHVMLIRTNRDLCDPRYLAAWLALPSTKAHIKSFNSGGSRRAITKGHIESFDIPLPPIELQRTIGDLSANINDRIDNLRQTNATLEAIAAALFKSWFVDFDGVSATDMRKSELGLIPKGWRIGSFDEAIEILGGGTPKTSIADYWNGDVPWFSVVDAPGSGQVFVLDTEKKITALGLQNCSAKLLPEMTTIISARGTVGKVAMTGVPMAMNQSCYALRPRQQSGEAFVYFSTRRFVEHLQRIAHGAVFDTITRDSFKQVTTCLPPDEVIAGFAEIANPLLERIRINGQQAAILAALRDALLPRLISGQLRVAQ